MANHWYPENWTNVSAAARRIREGDIVHNPVYARDCDRTREIAEELDRELAKRGLRIDHPQCCAGWVERIP